MNGRSAVTEVIWRPTPEVVAHANVTRLMRRHGLEDYGELVARSQAEPEWFWPAAVADMGLEFSTTRGGPSGLDGSWAGGSTSPGTAFTDGAVESGRTPSRQSGRGRTATA